MLARGGGRGPERCRPKIVTLLALLALLDVPEVRGVSMTKSAAFAVTIAAALLWASDVYAKGVFASTRSQLDL
jgi:hypothetical protein